MKKLKSQLGFTMIELLIVITILGILAVAVLSAINPIEQINRGRDTGTQSDAEQLLSAIDRYNAFQGFYPWQVNADAIDTSLMVDETGERMEGTQENFDLGLPQIVSSEGPTAYLPELDEDGVPTGGLDLECPVLARLSDGDANIDVRRCAGAEEIKMSFVNRLLATGTRSLYVYNSGISGGSTYVCFVPQSGAFTTTALERCEAGLPHDVGVAASDFICGENENYDHEVMSCLP